MNKLFLGFFDGLFVERPKDETGNDAKDNWLNNMIIDRIDKIGVLEDFAKEKIA